MNIEQYIECRPIKFGYISFRRNINFLKNFQNILIFNDSVYYVCKELLLEKNKSRYSINFSTNINNIRPLFVSRWLPLFVYLNYRRLSKLYSKMKKIKTFDLYTQTLNFFCKSGKKHSVIQIINNAFFFLSQQLRISKFLILNRFFNNFNLYVEVRKVKFRRNITFVPCFVSIKRRIHLLLTWLNLLVSRDKSPIAFEKRLLKEIFNVISNFPMSNLAKILKRNNQIAVTNRSKSHYRWY